MTSCHPTFSFRVLTVNCGCLQHYGSMFQGLQGKEEGRNEAFAFPDDKQESLEGKEKRWGKLM